MVAGTLTMTTTMSVPDAAVQPAAPPVAVPGPLAGPLRPRWQRALWLLAGALALATGIVGIVLPLLPTTPFVLLAALCFSRGSARLERWLLDHPRFGPLVRNWRAHHAIPLRAKQTAWVMMALGSAWAGWLLPAAIAWLPAAICLAVGVWMARLPSRAPAPAAAAEAGQPARPG
jgi:uncharacterized protein